MAKVWVRFWWRLGNRIGAGVRLRERVIPLEFCGLVLLHSEL
jgi:hypothetical protein